MVVLCIKTGEIVYLEGPFPPGECPDISCVRFLFCEMLEDGERAEADDGFAGEAPKHFKTPNMFTAQPEAAAMHQRVRSRHETVNKRFKQWGCMRQLFHHGVLEHSAAFRAVAVLTQLALEHGEPLFEVEYDDETGDDS